MFDIGFWEILLIGVVALLVIGPEKLPEVARTVGKWVAKVQRFVAGVKADINAELKSDELRKLLGDQENQIRELKEMVNEAKRGFEENANQATSLARESIDEVKTSLDSKKSDNTILAPESEQPKESDTPNERLG
ncbi:MAG: twin-arginine translocase subunit TatB [Gammaproteobacteria bacterium]|nr:twin-arginine translocase subunit TatB [Gammaproteobacteria bacterium]